MNYAKVWTSVLREPWFIAMSAGQRGIYLQLILLAKLEGDCGEVTRRSLRGWGEELGCDAETVRNFLRKFSDPSAISRHDSENAITLKLCKYMKWQGMTAEKSARNRRKIAANFLSIAEQSKAEQSRAKQSRAEHILCDEQEPVALTRNREEKISHGSLVWDAYSKAYLERYKKAPVRNAKMNALCKQLVDRLGKDQAPLVAAFYLSHGDRWYVQKRHLLEYCVKDAEKLLNEMETGEKTTATGAQTSDLASYNRNEVKKYLEKDGQNDW